MDRYTKPNKGMLREAFAEASTPKNDELLEFVRFLARVSTDKDYEEFLKKSKVLYGDPQKKGSKL